MKHIKLPSIRVHLFGYLFSPGWIPTLVTLLLLPFLISLGMWQLHRAAEKRAIEKDYRHQGQILAVSDLKDRQLKNLRYQKLKLQGAYDNDHIIYIDNKSYQGRHGFQVLVPFKLLNQPKYVLINRGFIEGGDRINLPGISKASGQKSIVGYISFPSKPFLLKKELWDGQWPILAQGIDLQIIAQQLKMEIYPFVLLQTDPDDLEFVRDWHPVSMPSYRHTGYAVQWFALALTLLIIYVRVNTRRIKRGSHETT